MRRSVFYAVVSAALLVTGAAVAISVTRYLSARMYAPPRQAPAASPRLEGPSLRTPPPDRWTNVFSPGTGMSAPARPDNAAAAREVPKSVFALVGTISSDNPDSARAILWSEGMKEPRLYRLNQEVEPGARLVRIDRDAAWLLRGKAREKLELLPVGSKARTPTPPAAPGAPGGGIPQVPAGYSAGGPDLRVTRISENTYSMDEAGLNQLTTNFNQFMTQVRLIPYFEGNKNAGYRLAAIRPGTAFEKMGFAGGDVIQAVNGIDLSSPERMFTIFQNLKDEKRVAVNILRQGQKTTLTYEIR